MKFNKILSTLAFALILAFAITNISATVTVTYNVSSAIIEDNAALNITDSTLLNGITVYVEGYSCLAVNCTAINNTAIPGLVSSTSTGRMTVVFPNNLPTSFGYVLYFHAPGYIGWEQLSNWNSPDLVNYTVNSGKIIYLSKKRNGNAPIMNLSVQEEIPTNTPIRIGFNVSIDANTYSAIARNARANLTLNETVQTYVEAYVFNSSGEAIYTANQTLNIPYSGNLPVNFTFPGFNQTGDYSVGVFTNVTDAKILNSAMQLAGSIFSVISQNLTNYTYTLINNLQISPALPRINENVTFSFNYLSGYVNRSGHSLPANTTLRMVIQRASDPAVLDNTVNVGSNGSYSFSFSFNQVGDYIAVITGTPNDTRGNLSLPSIQVAVFKVGPAENKTIIDDDDHDHRQEVRGEDATKKNYGDSLPLNSGSGEIIDLTPKKETKLGYKTILIWLIVLVLLLLIAVIFVYILRYI